MVEFSHSQALRGKIRMASRRLDAAAAALWSHAQFAAIYRQYLFYNHAVVRASVPLMRAALECATADSAADPVRAGLAAYLTQHIPEEMQHDDWLLDDLEALGADRATVLTRMPPPCVATLVGAQYYWIRHFHPVSLLGYIAVLEGTPPVAEHIDAVASRAGLPREAFSTMLRHAKLDPHHRDDLDRALDALPLTSEHAAIMGVSAFHTAHWLSRVVEEAITPPQRSPG